MNIFQEVINLEKRNLINPDDFITEVVDYFYSYDWLKHKGSKERVEFFISCGLNYEDFCNHFDTTYEAAKVSISYAGKKLKEKLGNTVKLISQGKQAEAQAEFYFLTGQSTLGDYITAPCLSLIPSAKYKTTRFENCFTELEFLRLYSKAELERIEGFIDKENLAYLRHVLEGSSPHLSEKRVLLLRLLQGELSADEIIDREV